MSKKQNQVEAQIQEEESVKQDQVSEGVVAKDDKKQDKKSKEKVVDKKDKKKDKKKNKDNSGVIGKKKK